MRVHNAILALLVFVILAVGVTACTENVRTKNFGGTMTIDLKPGQKLVNATWKDAQLWYLTRPMRSGETAESSTFSEQSSLGLMQGTVIFNEHPTK